MEDVWLIKSNQVKQTMSAMALVVAGGLLAYGFRHFDSNGFTNSLAAFLLGVLLLGIGGVCLLLGGESRVTVDGQQRLIIIDTTSRFGNKSRAIPFDDLTNLGVIRLGSNDGGSAYFDVVAHLNTGEKVYLFGHGFFDGKFSREKMEAHRMRAENIIFKQGKRRY